MIGVPDYLDLLANSLVTILTLLPESQKMSGISVPEPQFVLTAIPCIRSRAHLLLWLLLAVYRLCPPGILTLWTCTALTLDILVPWNKFEILETTYLAIVQDFSTRLIESLSLAILSSVIFSPI